MRVLVVLVLFGLQSVAVNAQTIAITNAEIHTVSGAVIPNGILIIQDSIITEIGTGIAIPSDAKVIDATGKLVTPGFMDSSSQMGLTEVGSTASTRDATTSEKDLGASFNVVWGVNPENSNIPITRLRGVTSSVVVPGGSQVFTGQGSVIALDGTSVKDMLRGEAVAVYTALGQSGAGRAGGSRAAIYQRLHDGLWDARAKMLKPEDEKKGDEKTKDEKTKEEETKDPKETGGRSSLNKRNIAALQKVMSGEIPLVISVNRISDMRLALSLQEEFKIKLVINGGGEAWQIADELAAAKVAVIVSATKDLPTFDALSASLENAGILAKAGVEVLLTGGRNLPHYAGLAVANGLDHAAALRAVTLGPATVWGLGESMGSLEKGKVADLVVWSGDPFELSSSAEHIFIGGREIPEDSRHEQLFDRYKDLGRYRRVGQ